MHITYSLMIGSVNMAVTCTELRSFDEAGNNNFAPNVCFTKAALFVIWEKTD